MSKVMFFLILLLAVSVLSYSSVVYTVDGGRFVSTNIFRIYDHYYVYLNFSSSFVKINEKDVVKSDVDNILEPISYEQMNMQCKGLVVSSNRVYYGDFIPSQVNGDVYIDYCKPVVEVNTNIALSVIEIKEFKPRFGDVFGFVYGISSLLPDDFSMSISKGFLLLYYDYTSVNTILRYGVGGGLFVGSGSFYHSGHREYGIGDYYMFGSVGYGLVAYNITPNFITRVKLGLGYGYFAMKGANLYQPVDESLDKIFFYAGLDMSYRIDREIYVDIQVSTLFVGFGIGFYL